jgi:hypothetical protein
VAFVSFGFISRVGCLSTYKSDGDSERNEEEVQERKRLFEGQIKRDHLEGRFNPVYRRQMSDSLDVTLPTGGEYELGIDASSKCVGIYVTDVDNRFHFICDFQRNSGDKYGFYREVKGFIRGLLKGSTLSMVVTEDIPPVAGRRNAGNVLRELRGVLNSWFAEDSLFSKVPENKRHFIMPQSWKSEMIDKSKGTGRFNNKSEIAADIVDKFPELAEFYRRCMSTDYDSFDACGLYHGYKAKHFSEDGKKVIAGTKSYYGSVLVFYRLIAPELLNNKKELAGPFVADIINNGIVALKWTDKNSPLDNFRIAASAAPLTVTIIDSLSVSLAIRWQFNLGLNNNQIIAYVFRKKLLKGKHLEYLKASMPYEEIPG